MKVSALAIMSSWPSRIPNRPLPENYSRYTVFDDLLTELGVEPGTRLKITIETADRKEPEHKSKKNKRRG